MKTFLLILIFSSLAQALSYQSSQLIQERLREEALKELSPEARVSVEGIFSETDIPLEATMTSLEPRPASGVVKFVFSWVDKNKRKESNGTAIIKSYLPVAIAKTPIRHNESFDPSNITMEERELSALRATGYFTKLEKVLALKSNGYLSPGTVIGFQHTQEPWLISQGQALDLVNQKGNLKVTVRALALESGKKDQWIRVENPISKKIIKARVENSSEVRMK